jgi:hypothetical protein
MEHVTASMGHRSVIEASGGVDRACEGAGERAGPRACASRGRQTTQAASRYVVVLVSGKALRSRSAGNVLADCYGLAQCSPLLTTA